MPLDKSSRGLRGSLENLYEATKLTGKMLTKLKHKSVHGHRPHNGESVVQSHHSLFQSYSELRKSIWYAFSTLAVSKDATAAVSTLKVLTSTIGRPLGFEKAEEILDKDHSRDTLDFESYFNILQKELLESIEKSSEETLKLIHPDFEEVHKVCWALYYNAYLVGPDSDQIPEMLVRKLWTMFNLLAEDDDDGVPLTPPRTDKEEMCVLLRAFVVASGQSDAELKIQEIQSEEGTMDFQEFKKFFINGFAPYFRFQLLSSTLETVYEEFVEDVLEKGMLFKRGHQVKNWKDRWMVLKPDGLRYFSGNNEKDLKGCVGLHTACTVEVVTDRHLGNKPNRFILNTNMKPYEMSAADIKTRNDWVKALQIAIDNADNPDFHYHKLQSKERQKQRKEKRRQREAEVARKLQDEETIRKLREEYSERHRQDELRLQEHLQALEAERLAKEDLEARLLKEAALREVEQRRLKELQEIKRQLEKLLEEERQAKKDEEIVRALQARLYEEECEKREELERLKREQDDLLHRERHEREGLQEMKAKQEALLQEARDKLANLESEREAANAQLEEATNKLQLAEKERFIMEEKVKLWKKPIGLARPVELKVDPNVTHRGKGAFCDDDFKKTPQWLKKYGVENEDTGNQHTNVDSQKSHKKSSGEESTEPKTELTKESENERKDDHDEKHVTSDDAHKKPTPRGRKTPKVKEKQTEQTSQEHTGEIESKEKILAEITSSSETGTGSTLGNSEDVQDVNSSNDDETFRKHRQHSVRQVNYENVDIKSPSHKTEKDEKESSDKSHKGETAGLSYEVMELKITE